MTFEAYGKVFVESFTGNYNTALYTDNEKKYDNIE